MSSDLSTLRGMLECKVCFRMLYEPYTTACGHTSCYSCLCNWLKNKSTCPACREPVTAAPAPSFLIRDMVQHFTKRADLLSDGETIEHHQTMQEEEMEMIVNDKANANPVTGGLFRGLLRPRPALARGYVDADDGVTRCPHCHWELLEGTCGHCGFLQPFDSLSDGESSEDAETDVDAELDMDDDDAHAFPPDIVPFEAFEDPSRDNSAMARAGRAMMRHTALHGGEPGDFVPEDFASEMSSIDEDEDDDDDDPDDMDDEEDEQDEEDDSLDGFIDDAAVEEQGDATSSASEGVHTVTVRRVVYDNVDSQSDKESQLSVVELASDDEHSDDASSSAPEVVSSRPARSRQRRVARRIAVDSEDDDEDENEDDEADDDAQLSQDHLHAMHTGNVEHQYHTDNSGDDVDEVGYYGDHAQDFEDFHSMSSTDDY